MKPFSARELLVVVRTHLYLARLRRECAEEPEQANKELEAFNYSVSHDLRAPLRRIEGFSAILIDENRDQLNERSRRHLERIQVGAQRMALLINDMLNLAQVTRSPLDLQPVNVTDLVRNIVAELRGAEPERTVEIKVEDGLVAYADPSLIAAVLQNLVGNAWKFSAKKAHARIEVGQMNQGAEPVFYVRDNGAGFDMAHSQKLFNAFVRLHTTTEFEGTGIGLATVRRIIARHNGRIWAEAGVDRGTTFFFTLEAKRKT